MTTKQIDEERFRRLLVLHEQDARAYILSMVLDWADAEDILQDTIVHLCEQIDSWNPDKDFRAWICAVAYYQVLTYRKREGRRRQRFTEAFIDHVAQRHESRMNELASRREALADCLEKLSPRNRQLVRLVYGEEMSVVEAATLWGRSLDAAYKSLSRVRAVLHRCVRRAIVELERE